MFISLKWKALAMSTVMLITLGLLFSYQSNQQLKDLFEKQRSAVQQKNEQEVHSLLEQSSHRLIKYAAFIPLMIDYNSDKNAYQASLVNVISEHAQYMQINWDIDAIRLYDHLGNAINAWENVPVSDTSKAAQRVAKSVAPLSYVQCEINCRQIITAPIILKNGQSFIIQLIISLTGMQQNFKKITRSNIGILSKIDKSAQEQLKDSHTEGYIKNWRHLVVSMTEMQDMRSLLVDSSEHVTFQQLKNLPRILNYEDNFYEIQLVPTEINQQQASYFVIVSDLTREYDRINDSLNALLSFTLGTTIVSGFIVVSLIWGLIVRLRKQSNLLPLLCEGKFQHVRDELIKNQKTGWLTNELDVLEKTELKVSAQLEAMQLKIQNNTERLRNLAMIDNVTQLGTRQNLLETCGNIISRDPEHETIFGLMFLDLDNFKRINDSLGHRYGDELLKIVGSRLSNCVRKDDLVCRFGGDEFCILGLGINHESQIQQMADNILNALRVPVCIDTKQLLVSASIGVATHPKDGTTVDELLQNADIALHEAKILGKNKIHVFTKDMNIIARENLTMESDLNDAIKNHEFQLYYQPKFDLKSGVIIGAEALIRWNHPTKGLIKPNLFIPFLEESGLILQVGEWVIKESFRACSRWRGNHQRELQIAINLSYRQFLEPELFDKIVSALNNTQIPPELIEFELTESMMMEDIELHNKTLKRLKSLGLKFAIDDFGTGYSSLSYLKQLAMDTLKIDRSFIKDIPHDASSMGIASAILAMSQKLRLKVVAEGIEDDAQRRFLIENDCEMGQGFFFSEALPEPEFLLFLETWNPSAYLAKNAAPISKNQTN